MFKKLVSTLTPAALAAAMAVAPAQAQDVKLGAVFSITGPIASLVPPIVASANLAVKHVNEQGGMLKGGKLVLVTADDQCDGQAAAAAANKLINIDQVVAVVGPLCSGAVMGAANAATIPAGVVVLSPSATAPTVTDLKDNDFVFRVAPSDVYQGRILARYLLKRGIKTVAVTYINNDYGVGLDKSFSAAFTAAGGKITGRQVHEAKKASYRSELATLARGKAPYLVVFAYSADSAPVIIRQSLEGGFFKKFVGSEGVKDAKLYEQIGYKNLEGLVLTSPGSLESKSRAMFEAELKKASPDSLRKPYAEQTYDATFLLALAVETAGTTDRTKVRDALRAIGKPGGVAILPGEWAKAKTAIAEKKKVFYNGAGGSYVFDKAGDVAGVIDVFEIKGGKEVKIETFK